MSFKTTFLKFIGTYHLSLQNALKLLKITNMPIGEVEVVNYGDILSLGFIMLVNGKNEYTTREIELHDLSI
jgi:hypothetical protein